MQPYFHPEASALVLWPDAGLLVSSLDSDVNLDGHDLDYDFGGDW